LSVLIPEDHSKEMSSIGPDPEFGWRVLRHRSESPATLSDKNVLGMDWEIEGRYHQVEMDAPPIGVEGLAFETWMNASLFEDRHG
jgi:hypothetical protein